MRSTYAAVLSLLLLCCGTLYAQDDELAERARRIKKCKDTLTRTLGEIAAYQDMLTRVRWWVDRFTNTIRNFRERYRRLLEKLMRQLENCCKQGFEIEGARIQAALGQARAAGIETSTYESQYRSLRNRPNTRGGCGGSDRDVCRNRAHRIWVAWFEAVEKIKVCNAKKESGAIPEKLYQAVAEILAYVYELTARRPSRGRPAAVSA